MNLASSKVFKGLAVGSLALAISGVATIPASFAADPAPAASQSSDARTIADKAMAKITQGLPGQFQVLTLRRPTRFGLRAPRTATSTSPPSPALTRTP